MSSCNVTSIVGIVVVTCMLYMFIPYFFNKKNRPLLPSIHFNKAPKYGKNKINKGINIMQGLNLIRPPITKHQ
jgi:glucose-6-phosphate-specific signal transduction histidine kinase